MFFENTFVQLMENVRCDTLEDVGVGEICPEGAIDFGNTLANLPTSSSSATSSTRVRFDEGDGGMTGRCGNS